MKKTLTILTAFLIFNSLYAQSSGKIIYKTISNINIEEIKIDEVKDMMKKVNAEITGFEFELLYNEDECLFKMTPVLLNDADNSTIHRIALAASYADQVCYYNKNENESVCQDEIFGETFLIKKENVKEELKWKLFPDSKMIGDHKVFKATVERIFIGSKGLATGTIEAWYCPDINLNYGPLGYVELPGLIMELTIQKVTYRVTDINSTKKGESISIKKPEKGKLVSEEEFYSIAEKKVGIF